MEIMLAQLQDLDRSRVRAVKRSAPPATPAEPLDNKGDALPLGDLTAEQATILDHVKAGTSVFFTGCAGTGKTALLRHIVHALKQRHGKEAVFVTASTGNAACHIGGTTVHHFAGMPPDVPRETQLKVASKVRRKEWARAKALVIDEVSMLPGDFLDALDDVARKVRRSPDPFGGLQLVFSGDFLQLPPVGRTGTERFAFEALSWGAAGLEEFELTAVFRQTDPAFIAALAKVRLGNVDAEVRALLSGRQGAFEDRQAIAPTRLFPTRAEVDAVNTGELARLAGPKRVFQAHDTGPAAQLNGCGCKELTLAIGAQVILLRNIDPHAPLVNGSRGVVIDFDAAGHPIVQFKGQEGTPRTIKKERWAVHDGPKLVASRRQYPLALGWALSIHKSQGLSLDAVEIDLARVFEAGQAYVGLSRVRKLDCLRLIGFQPSRIHAHPKALRYHEHLRTLFDDHARRAFFRTQATSLPAAAATTAPPSRP